MNLSSQFKKENSAYAQDILTATQQTLAEQLSLDSQHQLKMTVEGQLTMPCLGLVASFGLGLPGQPRCFLSWPKATISTILTVYNQQEAVAEDFSLKQLASQLVGALVCQPVMAQFKPVFNPQKDVRLYETTYFNISAGDNYHTLQYQFSTNMGDFFLITQFAEEQPLDIDYGGILVVDDSTFMCKLISRNLSRLGASQINVAHNGKSGLKLALTYDYDLILLDWNMPLMTGYEVLKEVRKVNDHTLIIMVTTEAEGIRKLQILEAGADGIITKPFNTTGFSEQILHLIKNSPRAKQKTKNFW